MMQIIRSGVAQPGFDSRGPCALLLAVLLCATSAVSGDLKLDPASIVFDNQKDAKTVRMSSGDLAVSGTALRRTRFLVGEHDYDHMIRVTAREGELEITPTADLQVGSFDLLVETDLGSAYLKVYSPLRELSDTLAAEAAALGLTVDEFRRKQGLTVQLRQEHITLDVPPVYFRGQALKIPLTSAPDRNHVWMINGKFVKQAQGEDASLEYLFLETGRHAIAYEERVGETGVAYANATVEVVDMPAVETEVKAGREVHFSAPRGYKGVQWTLEEMNAGSGDTFTHKFSELGAYRIVLRADKLDSAAGEFALLTFLVTVSP